MQEHPHTSGPDDEAQSTPEELNQNESEQSSEATSQDHPVENTGDSTPETTPEQPATEPAPAPTAEEPVAETPAEKPAAETPGEPLVEAPAEKPAAETPGEPLVEAPAEKPAAETPGEPLVEAPAEKPAAETPGEPLVEAPAEKPAAETPGEPLVEAPAEKPAAETPGEPLVEAPAEDASAEAPAEPEVPAEPIPLSPAQQLLEELIKDDNNFEKVIAASSPQECILLVEAITEREDVRPLIPKVVLIRQRFDSLEKSEEETIPNEIVIRYNTALARFNRRRAQAGARMEENKEENSRLKYELLERLKKIVEDELVDSINEVREIQAAWKEVGWVMKKDIQNLSRTYSTYLDYFYNLRGQYNALRDLDRQHNMAEKEKVIAEIDSLVPSETGYNRESWKTHSEKVRTLQEFFKTIGPIPRDNLDDLMSRYRATLDKFYGARQTYYDEQDEQKKGNIAIKQAVIDKLHPYSEFKSAKAKDWNQATNEVLKLQEEWKKIGPAPQEINRELWKLYRQTCDAFFESKSAFFKAFDEIRAENLKKKIALCDQAEALMDNENWKETAQKLKELQTEWKTIGPVHDRYSNKVWKRFRKACDHFFNRRDDASSSRQADYTKNQEVKESLIAELKALVEANDPENQVNAFKSLQDRWKKTGHVPIKEKDRINNTFRDLAASFYEKLKKVSGSSRFVKLDLISDPKVRTRRVDGEIQKIQRKIRAAKEKVESYGTNILYISKGKSGDSLRKMIQTQIDDEKARIEKMKQQIQDIRDREANKEANAAKAAEEAKAAAKAKAAKEAAAKAAAEAAPEAPAAEEAAPEAPAAEEAAPEAPAAEEAAPEAPAAEEAAPEAPAAEEAAPEAPAAEEAAPEAPAAEEATPEAPAAEEAAPEAPAAEEVAPEAPAAEEAAPEAPAAEEAKTEEE